MAFFPFRCVKVRGVDVLLLGDEQQQKKVPFAEEVRGAAAEPRGLAGWMPPCTKKGEGAGSGCKAEKCMPCCVSVRDS